MRVSTFKYFADTSAGTLEFNNADYRKDGAYGFDKESQTWVKITRKINYKTRPSKHECDDRCMTASGKTMTCECACGGANHGKNGIRV